MRPICLLLSRIVRCCFPTEFLDLFFSCRKVGAKLHGTTSPRLPAPSMTYTQLSSPEPPPHPFPRTNKETPILKPPLSFPMPLPPYGQAPTHYPSQRKTGSPHLQPHLSPLSVLPFPKPSPTPQVRVNVRSLDQPPNTLPSTVFPAQRAVAGESRQIRLSPSLKHGSSCDHTYPEYVSMKETGQGTLLNQSNRAGLPVGCRGGDARGLCSCILQRG